ncbi:MAG: hypothetical protein AB1390_09370 [Nitrospirota bacterium]
MLNRQELKELAKMQGDGSFFVSLYLNVDPTRNTKIDYVIHLKNMLKEAADKLEKNVLKKVNNDVEKIESYVFANRKMFKRGLAVISSQGKKFWREFHLAVPVKNEIVIDSTPYLKPLLDILDNYQRYALLLVGKDAARLFLVHLGEIEEYTEVRSMEVPGRHKKGGWFALAEKNYERHIDRHVDLHLKDVLKRLEEFLSREYVGRLLIGGPGEAVTRFRLMLPPSIADKVIGTFQAEMFANSKDILEKANPILNAYEKEKEDETVHELLTKALKNENAVIGIEDVLHALQEGRVMKLIFVKDFKRSGFSCAQCGFMTTQIVPLCPYCRGEMHKADYMVDSIAQKAIEQGAFVEVVSDNKKLQESGNIGAFLRF